MQTANSEKTFQMTGVIAKSLVGSMEIPVTVARR
jgi:hypothetical protein